MTRKLYAQGDILLETVDNIAADRLRRMRSVPADADGAVVLGRGERSGHRHAIHGGAQMVRDRFFGDSGVPGGLYVGHLVVEGEAGATLVHEEHGSIALPPGTYRVRRQRQFSAAEERRQALVAD
jgi:hypothetical protein